MQNFFRVTLAIVLLTITGVVIGDFILYPLLLFHQGVINVAGFILVAILLVLAMQAFRLHVKKVRSEYEILPQGQGQSKGGNFTVYFLQRLAMKSGRLVVYTIMLALLVLLIGILLTVNQSVLFRIV